MSTCESRTHAIGKSSSALRAVAMTEGFDPADVERVRNMVMITDEQYETLVADGRIKAGGTRRGAGEETG